MAEYTEHRRKATSWLKPYEPGEDITGVFVSAADVVAGSPKEGDWIARSPADPDDRWLVSADYYAASYEPA